MEKIVSYEYDAYGNIIEINSDEIISNINPFRYRGYYFDNESSKYYLNTRYYDASLYRFLTLDDFGYLGSTDRILSYNLYNYCENNPIKYFDKFGTIAEENVILSIIIDMKFNQGLPFFGHALLLVSDYEPSPFIIEVHGLMNDKSATKANKKTEDSKIAIFKDGVEGLNKNNGNWFYKLTINGRFKNFETTYNEAIENYMKGKYNLFSNNCLHLIKNILNKGTYENKKFENYVKHNYTFIPILFYNNIKKILEEKTIEPKIIIMKMKLNTKYIPIILRGDINEENNVY